MLVLIFDTVEPYVYEALPILFYPSGTIYEARFKLKHIHSSILSRLDQQSDANKTNWDDILICLRSNTYKANEKSAPFFFVDNHIGKPQITPMRIARTISITRVADFVLIRYQVAQFFNPGMIGKLFNHDTAVRDLNTTLYEHGEFRENGTLFHLFSTDQLSIRSRFYDVELVSDGSPTLDIERESNAWRGVVSSFLFLPHLHHHPFLFFVGIRRIGGDRGTHELRDQSDGSLVFKSNSTYELKVLEAYPSELNDLSVLHEDAKAALISEAPSRKYSVKLDDNFFTSGFKQRAIGGYDFLEFSVPVRPDTHGNTGVLRFMIDHWVELEGERSPNLISEQLTLEYKVRTGPRRIAGWLGLFAILVSAVMSNIDHSYVAWVPKDSFAYDWLLNVGIDLISATIYTLGVIGMVTALLGYFK